MSQPYQPGVADPDLPAINIELRLASENDLDRLKEITTVAVQPNDGSINGQRLKCHPDAYWANFEPGLRAFACNESRTCIVAETKNEAGSMPTIVGYCVWIWVEHSLDNMGR
jgi:hypothetical protein